MNFVTYFIQLTPQKRLDFAELCRDKVNEFRGKDLAFALNLAQMLIALGVKSEDIRVQALGTMVYADSLWEHGRYQEMWDLLGQAGRLFEDVQDSIGWARTRITRVAIATHIGKLQDAIQDAEKALSVFEENELWEFCARMCNNQATMALAQKQPLQALNHLENALQYVNRLAIPPANLPKIFNNLGIAHLELGNLFQSQDYFQKSYDLYLELGQTHHLNTTYMNLASTYRLMGNYRESLRILLEVLPSLTPQSQAVARFDIIYCYLGLGRYEQAIEIGEALLNDTWNTADHAQRIASVYLALATAYANQPLTETTIRYEKAQAYLQKAQTFFEENQLSDWVNMVRLQEAQLHFENGDSEQALHLTTELTTYFQGHQQKLEHLSAVLVRANALAQSGDIEQAQALCQEVDKQLQDEQLPVLAYENAVLMGQLAEIQRQPLVAIQYYQQAVQRLEQIGNQLTVALRPYFVAKRQQAMQGLMRLFLNQQSVAEAWLTLEKSRSQAMMNAVANGDYLRRNIQNPVTKDLLQRLNDARAEYEWLSRIVYMNYVYDQEVSEKPQLDMEEARLRLRSVQQQVLTLNEQIALQSEWHSLSYHPDLEEIQATLNDHSVVISYYEHENQLSAFILTANSVQEVLLPQNLTEINEWLRQVRQNIRSTVGYGVGHRLVANRLRDLLPILMCLHEILLAPLMKHIDPFKRWIIVPYGALHNLPFHLLHTGGGYIFEHREIVIQPIASLLTRPTVNRDGVRILGYADATAPLAVDQEAESMAQILSISEKHLHSDATSTHLFQYPTKVLHLICHGEHHEIAELSCLYLADGRLFVDDLLQYDLSYELIVLSACETGLAKVTDGDDLIGLNRGFLYAGARSLVSSLWRVPDKTTVTLMTHFYQGIRAGDSKVVALRNAQLALMQDPQTAHPAFWGAFQLIGNPESLAF